MDKYNFIDTTSLLTSQEPMKPRIKSGWVIMLIITIFAVVIYAINNSNKWSNPKSHDTKRK